MSAHPFRSIISPPPAIADAARLGGNPFVEGLVGAQPPERHAPIDAHPAETRAINQPASAERVETGLTTLPALRRPPLSGGRYSPQDALAVLNAYYFVGKSNQETGIFRIDDDGTATFLPPDQFKLEIQHMFVGVNSNGAIKFIPAEKFWRENANRNQKRLVFKPGGTTDPCEYNLWRGFGVAPCKGWRKQKRFLRHILKIICRSDKAKFKYLIRALAWMVQNPDKHTGVVIVLMSRKQGTGKTTVGKVMLDIFGPHHGVLVDDKERLLGRFTDWLEPTAFVLAEEMLFAGDLKGADKLKSLVTGDTLQIERKHGSVRQVPNRLKIIATTNHDHAISAGVQDRRNVVFDVSDEHAGDKAWFNALYGDLADGGTSEFLWFLQNLKLGDWHPSRDFLRTAETAEQQRMSGDSVSQWAQACIEADAVIGAGRSTYGPDTAHDLGAAMGSDDLRNAYTGFCRQNGLRPLTTDGFGKACADMFGPRRRMPAKPSPTGKGKRRPWGYHVPKGNKWQEKVDARLGIKK